jgi:hypothetical protein
MINYVVESNHANPLYSIQFISSGTSSFIVQGPQVLIPGTAAVVATNQCQFFKHAKFLFL